MMAFKIEFDQYIYFNEFTRLHIYISFLHFLRGETLHFLVADYR